MWKYLVRFILRNRLLNVVGIVAITLFMGYQAKDLRISYQMAQMLPATDSTFINYQQFKKQFGEDGSVLFVGIKDKDIWNIDHFNAWYDLAVKVKELDGVQEVMSISRLYKLIRNDSLHKFDFTPVIQHRPETQEELDSLHKVISSIKIYDGLVFNSTSQATLMMITLDKQKLNTPERIGIIDNIEDVVYSYSEQQGVAPHFSGLPYIRTKTTKMAQNELRLFVLLALLVAALALFVFFRSFKAVLFPMLIVVISTIWAMGIIALLGYEITILTGIIPPLIIVIGVENCIFLLNKYHHEYKSHGNKVRALSRVVTRVGSATFLTNLTTATGFAAFIITGSNLLIEFGIVASINIMVVFFLSLFLIPIFFSYLDPPGPRHLKHLENKHTTNILRRIVNTVMTRRRAIYITAILFSILAAYGVTRLKTTGSIVDDISKGDQLYKDLMFLEHEFKGVLPFEVSIDTHKKRGILQYRTMQKIDQLQDSLAIHSEFSKPISMVEALKYLRQAFYNGDPSMYAMPDKRELSFILGYLPKNTGGKNLGLLNSFVDSTMSKTRVSVQMANIGTRDIQRIMDDLQPKVDQIFNSSHCDVEITGSSVVFLKGTDYLVKNLITSLLLAVAVITLLMSLLFSSARMVLISLIPNMLPQFMAAALMGFTDISIKPSTILIFSVALGISVDNAIHFLSRYRLQLRLSNWNIRESVLEALRETGFSMIYSSIVLFFGFGMFSLSSFGGTQAMGYLVSFTLLVAVLCNLFLLPALLLTFENKATTEAFKEPLLEIFDEEDDIDVDELEIEVLKKKEALEEQTV